MVGRTTRSVQGATTREEPARLQGWRAVSFVLDSFALLAYLNDEPGRGQVQAILSAAGRGECRVYASMVNIGEVLYITEREVGLAQARAVLAAMDQLPMAIVPADREVVLAAAHIKANHRLSYADAFAVVAAQWQGATLVTGDGEFASVSHLVALEWLPAE